MTAVLLDTHVLHWLTAEPDRLSPAAEQTIESADELAVAGITWYELGWLATHGRIVLAVPVRTWLAPLAEQVTSVPLSPSIAVTAAELPSTFPGDPADRIIFATAVERGWQLVTKDRRIRQHPHPRPLAV